MFIYKRSDSVLCEGYRLCVSYHYMHMVYSSPEAKEIFSINNGNLTKQR